MDRVLRRKDPWRVAGRSPIHRGVWMVSQPDQLGWFGEDIASRATLRLDRGNIQVQRWFDRRNPSKNLRRSFCAGTVEDVKRKRERARKIGGGLEKNLSPPRCFGNRLNIPQGKPLRLDFSTNERNETERTRRIAIKSRRPSRTENRPRGSADSLVPLSIGFGWAGFPQPAGGIHERGVGRGRRKPLGHPGAAQRGLRNRPAIGRAISPYDRCFVRTLGCRGADGEGQRRSHPAFS